ncbi:MAG: GNAT family N-acetyltransferase [Pseudanabaenaceae cyanobacterium]
MDRPQNDPSPRAACYTEVPPETAASIQGKQSISPATGFVALSHGEVVGYLLALPWQFAEPPALNAEIDRRPVAPDCLYLHDLVVSPTTRNQGVGRAPIDTFFECLPQSGLRRASWVAVQNAAPYWQRFGFRSVAPSPSLQSQLTTYSPNAQYMVRWSEPPSTGKP